MRVGRITDLPQGADPDVVERTEQAFDALAAAGARIVDVEVPAFTYGLTAYYIIAPAEASSNLARYDGVRYGLRVEAPDTNAMYAATRTAGFGDEVGAGSCSAPTRCRRGTTTPTTARRFGSGG